MEKFKSICLICGCLVWGAFMQPRLCSLITFEVCIFIEQMYSQIKSSLNKARSLCHATLPTIIYFNHQLKSQSHAIYTVSLAANVYCMEMNALPANERFVDDVECELIIYAATFSDQSINFNSIFMEFECVCNFVLKTHQINTHRTTHIVSKAAQAHYCVCFCVNFELSTGIIATVKKATCAQII